MKNISKKRNYKLTARRARINTGSIWPSYLVIAIFFTTIGFGVAYHFFNGGKSINFLLTINDLEEFSMEQEKEALALKLELKMSRISSLASLLASLRRPNTLILHNKDICF